MLTAITGVFDSIGDWLISALGNMTDIFWNATDSSLTMLGTLAICGLAFSVIFLVVGIIQRFLKFGA